MVKLQFLKTSKTVVVFSGMHAFIRKLLSLRFLPAAHIERAVDYLSDKATTDATRGLVQYVRRQWLRNATFRVEDWSVYKQTIRTNNDVEGKEIC